MKKYTFKTFYHNDDNCWFSICEQHPCVSAFGNTPQESINELMTAMEGVIQVLKEDGEE